MKKILGALILTACASMLNANAPDGNPTPINPPANYDGGNYYGNYGSSYTGGGSGPSNPSCGRCTQGCNPRTGRMNQPPPPQGPQGPQGPYQQSFQGPQSPYPQGQYRPMPQGPYQQGMQYQQGQQQPGMAPGQMQQCPQGQMQAQQGQQQPGMTSGQNQNPQQMGSKIQDSLHGTFSTKYNNVTASFNNGVVTLQGTVATQEDKNDLEQKVSKMDGVQSVNNQVTVQPTQGQAPGSNTGSGYSGSSQSNASFSK